jgi:hypothetical protein
MAISSGTLVIWAADSLEKIPQDAQPDAGPDAIEADACRGEVVSAQLAVRVTKSVRDLHIQVSSLTHAEAGATGIDVRPRFVGYVPVEANTPDTPMEEVICNAPCLVADPLLVDETAGVEADSTQPVWLTISVPTDAPPGPWLGTIRLSAGGEKAEVPLRLTVHPVTLPAERSLWVTNWMNLGNFATFYGTEPYTDRFWRVVETFAANMAAHRQNVVLCPNDLIQIFQEADGGFAFDFTRYDRWVGIFDKAGCAELLEGGHLGRRGEGKWETPWFEWRRFPVRRRDGALVEADAETVVRELVTNLLAHVRERGWLDRFVMHIVDEPAPHTEEDYKKKSELVHQWAPGVRFLEAMSLMDARGHLDIWVPQLSHFDEHMDHYLKMRDESGIELWHYTCMYPTGLYPNRFLDFSLAKTRLLHWINWRYRLTGYLHWGLNYWTENPFHEDRLRGDLPPGDSWIVYPGTDGPIDSIRWEQMREGIQDYELLRLLDARSKETGRLEGRADEICSALVPDPTSYSRDQQSLRQARGNVISALQELEG